MAMVHANCGTSALCGVPCDGQRNDPNVVVSVWSCSAEAQGLALATSSVVVPFTKMAAHKQGKAKGGGGASPLGSGRSNGEGYQGSMSSSSSSLYSRAPKSGVAIGVCKRFGRGSLGGILWLVGGEVASRAVEKKAGGRRAQSLLSGLLCSRCKA
jgi:hypothetical protein